MPKRSAPVDSKEPSNPKRGKTSQSTIDNKGDMLALRSAKRIVVVGLDGHGKPRSKPSSLKGKFPKVLQEAIDNAQKSNLELDMYLAHPSNFPAIPSDLRKKLEAKPEGILIGNGIRGNAEYTVFFEDLVNACREITPGTRMGFNTSPNDIVEACLRNFK